MGKAWFKRKFDIFLSLFGLSFFSPLFILCSLLIWLEDRGPILYRQVRLGKDGRKFQILKFRSMAVGSKEIPTGSISDYKSHIKITKIGKILRETALDELPQLINILKGDMSFVGPRPLMLPEEQELNPQERSLRSSIRPGLTGLAQVYADKYISNKEKLKYDLQYINNQSFGLDIKLIFRSLLITLGRKWEEKGR